MAYYKLILFSSSTARSRPPLVVVFACCVSGFGTLGSSIRRGCVWRFLAFLLFIFLLLPSLLPQKSEKNKKQSVDFIKDHFCGRRQRRSTKKRRGATVCVLCVCRERRGEGRASSSEFLLFLFLLVVVFNSFIFYKRGLLPSFCW